MSTPAAHGPAAPLAPHTPAAPAARAKTEVGHGPELIDVKLNVVTPKAPVVGTVVSTKLCTAGRKAAGVVRHVEIDVSGTPLAGVCRAGQSFGIVPPGNDAAGKPHKVRLYSLSSPSRGEDGAGNVISTCCKRVIDEHWETHRLFLGACSNYVCDLQVGDKVNVTGPSGKRFVLPKNAGDYNYLFISTGTGIAPFRGMTIDLFEAGFKNQAILISGSTYATDLLYHDKCVDFAHKHKNFKYYTAISREKQADGHDPMYVDGRIASERDEIVPMLTQENTLIYICGLAGMELGIYRQLAAHLTGDSLAQYLQADGTTLANYAEWDKKTIGREVKKTERIMTEVYD
jgi:ferredoxin--NADP+ reductase